MRAVTFVACVLVGAVSVRLAAFAGDCAMRGGSLRYAVDELLDWRLGAYCLVLGALLGAGQWWLHLQGAARCLP